MRDFDWNRIQQSKAINRARNAALPPEERLRLIEQLRDQGLAMKGEASLRPRDSVASLQINPREQTAGVIHLNVLGINATLVTAVTPSNITAAGKNQNDRTR